MDLLILGEVDFRSDWDFPQSEMGKLVQGLAEVLGMELVQDLGSGWVKVSVQA